MLSEEDQRVANERHQTALALQKRELEERMLEENKHIIARCLLFTNFLGFKFTLIIHIGLLNSFLLLLLLLIVLFSVPF